MRPLRLILLLTLLAAVSLPQAGLAAQRIVLLETFTNVSCGPCADANPVTHDFVTQYGNQLVLNLQYHVNWPSATDPFYLRAPDENNGRRTYYGVNAVPDLYTDGMDVPAPGSYNGLVAAVGERLSTPSPLTILVTTEVVGDQITVDAEVTAVDEVPGSDLVVHIALTEPYVNFPTPPGSNGETDFHYTMRDMLPSVGGTPLSITNGQTVNISETGTLDPAWVDVYAVVWVQNNATKEVLQAASSLPAPDYAFYFTTEHANSISPLGALVGYHAPVTNLGLMPDIYDVHIEKNVYANWGASVCVGEICYPPWVTDFTMEVNAGMTDTVLVDIQPLVDEGGGTVTLTATSQGNPTQSWTQSFTVITEDTDILLVDDDGGEDFEQYFQGALRDSAYTFGTWDLERDGKLGAPDLNNFQVVMWNVGWAFPSVDASDRAALANYLETGGKLFITGQDIGWDLFDPGSDNSSPEAQNWYRTYLGANYLNDDTNDLTIVGVAGDPIGDGLAFNIFGGDGANNQDYPSEIEPFGDGVACLQYDATREAAVHLFTDHFKSVYFAFGFEGIATGAQRTQVMQRVLEWLQPVVDVPGEEVVAPFLAGQVEARPNPFNPVTHIKFDIGGSQAADLEVAVYDLRGRLLQTVYKGQAMPGHQDVLWDGRAANGRHLASGVYLAKVKVNGQQQTLKMTLAK